jgi:hypothetical protein
MPIAVLGVLFVVVAVNLFLYFGYYSSKTPTPLPAEHASPSTTIGRPERAGPKEGTIPEVTRPERTRPERTRPATTLQSTIPNDQSATATATSSPSP